MSFKKYYTVDPYSENPCSKFLIYAILDPESQEIAYVGRSSSGLRRPKSHFMPCNLKKKLPITNWIKNKISNGLVPIIIILETSNNSGNLNALEIFYIRESKEEGSRLKNLTLGGGGTNGLKRSEEVIQKLSIANKGNKPSDFCMAKCAEYRKNAPPISAAQKQKLRENSAKSLKILCLNNAIVYSSARHAQETFTQIKCHKSILKAARNGKEIFGLKFILLPNEEVQT